MLVLRMVPDNSSTSQYDIFNNQDYIRDIIASEDQVDIDISNSDQIYYRPNEALRIVHDGVIYSTPDISYDKIYMQVQSDFIEKDFIPSLGYILDDTSYMSQNYIDYERFFICWIRLSQFHRKNAQMFMVDRFNLLIKDGSFIISNSGGLLYEMHLKFKDLLPEDVLLEFSTLLTRYIWYYKDMQNGYTSGHDHIDAEIEFTKLYIKLFGNFYTEDTEKQLISI